MQNKLYRLIRQVFFDMPLAASLSVCLLDYFFCRLSYANTVQGAPSETEKTTRPCFCFHGYSC